MTVNELREEISRNIGDPFMERVNRDLLFGYINQAARILRNKGWLLPIEPALIYLESEVDEYDVPASFTYIKEIRMADKALSAADTVLDTGVDLAEALDTTETGVDVTDATIFVVNDILQVDEEIMLITSISGSTLNVRRGEFGTDPDNHSSGAAVLRPGTDRTYDYVIPRAYWRLQTGTGGQTTDQAGRGSRPLIIFNDWYFSYTVGTPIKVIGQKRPTIYTAGTSTVDDGMESFLEEQAGALACRFLTARGSRDHAQIAVDMFARANDFLRYHPSEFRVKTSSTHVPGR